MKRKLSWCKAPLCILLAFCILFQSCRKERLPSLENNFHKQLISQSKISNWYKTNRIAALIAPDWKKAKQAKVEGKNVVRVPILNIDKISPALEKQNKLKQSLLQSTGSGSSNSGNNNYSSSHPPELFFIEDNKGSLHSYLLNFLPDNQSFGNGENENWTGKLLEWNLSGDTILVQTIKNSKLQDIHVEKMTESLPDQDMLNVLKSAKKSSIGVLKERTYSDFWEWLSDLFPSVLGWIGSLFGLSDYSENFNHGHGGYRLRIYLNFLTGEARNDSEGIGVPTPPDSNWSTAYIGAGTGVYSSYMWGYLGGGGSGGPSNYQWEEYAVDENGNIIPTDFYDPDPLQVYDWESVYSADLGRDVSFQEIREYFENSQTAVDDFLAENDAPPTGTPILWPLLKTYEGMQEYYALKVLHPTWGDTRLASVAMWNVLSGTIHFALDVGGLVPVIGEPIDILNGAIYFLEGNNFDAALSVGAAVPVWGWTATGGKWVKNTTKTLTRPISDAVGKVSYRAIQTAKGGIRFVKVTVGNFSHSALTALKAVKPADRTLTNLSRQIIDQMSHRIKPTLQSLQDQIDDIVMHADVAGIKTENLSDDIFQNAGFTKHNAKFGSNNGFDGVYIKYDGSGNVQEIIINEAKQVTAMGNIRLNPANANTGLKAQMSDGWINDIIGKMKLEGGNLSLLSDVLNANKNKITKTITGVDKSSSEIVILKLSNY